MIQSNYFQICIPISIFRCFSKNRSFRNRSIYKYNYLIRLFNYIYVNVDLFFRFAWEFAESDAFGGSIFDFTDRPAARQFASRSVEFAIACGSAPLEFASKYPPQASDIPRVFVACYFSCQFGLYVVEYYRMRYSRMCLMWD